MTIGGVGITSLARSVRVVPKLSHSERFDSTCPRLLLPTDKGSRAVGRDVHSSCAANSSAVSWGLGAPSGDSCPLRWSGDASGDGEGAQGLGVPEGIIEPSCTQQLQALASNDAQFKFKIVVRYKE